VLDRALAKRSSRREVEPEHRRTPRTPLVRPGASPIESVHNRRVVAARRLRHHPGEWVLAEGPTLLEEALRAGVGLRTVFLTPHAREGLSEILEGTPTCLVTPQVMRGLAETTTPQGVVAVVRNPAISLDALLASRPERVLVLSDVRDPGNVGTALRTAEAAGFDAAVVCSGSADPVNAKALRASAGAVFHLPYSARIPDVDTLDALAGYRRIGAAVTGTTELADLDSRPPLAIIIGNEARGFAPNVATLLDETVMIPMRGRIGSLNAAVAASLIAYRVGS
jgi:RNA methyltransferase, TrmH family